jgi:D-arabinose 1-dehydrogenase-like Zn-dependent alcohol dehydrogenase
MRAAVLEQYQQPLRVTEQPDPEIGPHDVLVRVQATGICRTDWHMWHGDWEWLGIRPPVPHVMGHEFAGTVESVGSAVESVKIGDRVTVPFHEGCGRCSACTAGRSNQCLAPTFPGGTHTGSFGELVAVLNADFNCIALADAVSFEAGALLGCRCMTAYRAVARHGAVRGGQSVAVLGVGGLGLAAVQIASALGARVVAVDINPAALRKAEELGADVALDAAGGDPGALVEATSGGADVVIDTICRQETITQAVLAARAGGTLVQAGLTTSDLAGNVTLPIDVVTARELVIKGSWGNPRSDYTELLALVESGRVRPQELVERRIDVSEIDSVFEEMSHHTNVGVAIVDRYRGVTA